MGEEVYDWFLYSVSDGIKLYACQAVTAGAPLLALDTGCCQSGWVPPGVVFPVYSPMVLQQWASVKASLKWPFCGILLSGGPYYGWWGLS